MAVLKENNGQQENTDGVGLKQVLIFLEMMLESLRLIEIEPGINKKIDGDHDRKHTLVLNQLPPVAISGKESFKQGTVKADIIAETKR